MKLFVIELSAGTDGPVVTGTYINQTWSVVSELNNRKGKPSREVDANIQERKRFFTSQARVTGVKGDYRAYTAAVAWSSDSSRECREVSQP